MNLYTADQHFGHRNIIRLDHRPFADVEDMDSCLIKLWNERVQRDDTVYILGDICYRSGKSPSWYLKQLKGHKVLIRGNHDGVTLKDEDALKLLDGVESLLEISDNGKQIVMCHYPLAEWPGFFRGAYHIYGHIHSNKNVAYDVMKQFDTALNAGCMINGYAPASLNELIRNNKIFKES